MAKIVKKQKFYLSIHAHNNYLHNYNYSYTAWMCKQLKLTLNFRFDAIVEHVQSSLTRFTVST